MLEHEKEIEKEIQEKELNAPRITPADIDALHAEITYHVYHVPNTTTTLAVAFDRNGFSLAVGQSACASPENFDAAIGEKNALKNAAALAREELWKLEGYRLKCALAAA